MYIYMLYICLIFSIVYIGVLLTQLMLFRALWLPLQAAAWEICCRNCDDQVEQLKRGNNKTHTRPHTLKFSLQLAFNSFSISVAMAGSVRALATAKLC